MDAVKRRPAVEEKSGNASKKFKLMYFFTSLGNNSKTSIEIE